MNNHPADRFILELSSTVKDFKTQADQSKELGHLIDMSAHMIAALGALRSTQIRSGSGSSQSN